MKEKMILHTLCETKIGRRNYILRSCTALRAGVYLAMVHTYDKMDSDMCGGNGDFLQTCTLSFFRDGLEVCIACNEDYADVRKQQRHERQYHYWYVNRNSRLLKKALYFSEVR